MLTNRPFAPLLTRSDYGRYRRAVLPAARSTALLLALVTALAGIGVGIASGHLLVSVATAALPIAALLAGRVIDLLDRVPATVRTTSFIWIALAASTLVWRGRTTTQLAQNPLDRAALVRVAFVSIAGFLALLVLVNRLPSRVPVPIWAYGGYAAVALIAAADSPSPLVAAYRVYELTACVAVVLVFLVHFEDRAGEVMMRLAVGALALLVTIAWIEAIVVPSQAWESSGGGIVSRSLGGVLPSVSSNSLGAYGGLLALWGLARLGDEQHSQLTARLALGGGLLTLLAAQYRTGVIAFLFCAGLVLWFRRRWGLMALAIVGAACLLYFVGLGESLSQAEVILARGHPELLHNLDSRTVYWQAARPYILDRPIVGWGLNVKSRDVLASLGLQDTSTIHGTWPEALLGAGVVGTALLALTFLSALWAAWRVRLQSIGAGILAMLVFFVFRSITGSTIELFSDVLTLVFAALAVAAVQLANRDNQTARPEMTPA